MTHAITTLFGIGHLRPAPGTWGSLAALPLAYLLHLAGGFWVFFIATILVAGLGWWATGVETRDAADHDPSEIVIDEVVGQWIALWPVSFGAMFADMDMLRLWPGLLSAFIAFRAFDILKPGPVGWADGLKGPTGVMLDDIIAGWMAALVVAVLAVFAHLVLV
ncbi:phosphatidylglycerophosphatase A [Rhodophyticola sp. CCM32]|uniref:phosphatidylglycerophosphatase A family protein n=1 Tax=Rhodophyticola sp. CCM32 TaxID=2916397 RepID=UPI00107FB1D4|nr:phosphatidylglycerophosphatase A [Rhodophyticola sp. CCM32]QBY00270.1 phosphatidylglycerophosphatase A [Rhodophyticola sp. CCM32]